MKEKGRQGRQGKWNWFRVMDKNINNTADLEGVGFPESPIESTAI